MNPHERPQHANSAELIEKYRAQWETLGRHDPYWAVLTDPAKKNGRWEKDAFYALGEQEIAQVFEQLKALEITPHNGIALDFGCGVGRLSRALAAHFQKVIGVDISRAMLAEATAQHAAFPNIEFVHNTAPDLTFIPDEQVDFIYTNIVLQHIPPSLQTTYIAEFCRILAPGGLAVFQTPSSHDLTSLRGWIHQLAGNRVMNVMRRILHGKEGVMEIHVLPRDKVQAILQDSRASLLLVERYDSSGPGFCSYRYYAVKNAARRGDKPS